MTHLRSIKKAPEVPRPGLQKGSCTLTPAAVATHPGLCRRAAPAETLPCRPNPRQLKDPGAILIRNTPPAAAAGFSASSWPARRPPTEPSRLRKPRSCVRPPGKTVMIVDCAASGPPRVGPVAARSRQITGRRRPNGLHTGQAPSRAARPLPAARRERSQIRQAHNRTPPPQTPPPARRASACAHEP